MNVVTEPARQGDSCLYLNIYHGGVLLVCLQKLSLVPDVRGIESKDARLPSNEYATCLLLMGMLG